MSTVVIDASKELIATPGNDFLLQSVVFWKHRIEALMSVNTYWLIGYPPINRIFPDRMQLGKRIHSTSKGFGMLLLLLFSSGVNILSYKCIVSCRHFTNDVHTAHTSS